MSSSYDKYSVTQYSISSILGYIEAGDIAIPEIQRPFVWKGKQVRDLIDSLYSGYPTGYLIIWQNPSVRLKDGKESVGKKILIDGQQRVTALMTAIAGHPVLDDNYKSRTIKIAFNPLNTGDGERFDVQAATHLKSKAWIPDISEMFAPSFNTRKFINAYLEANPDADEDLVDSSIMQLLSIKSCQIGVITLVPQLDISEVTEIFVRINSQGTSLNESDFAMSKIAADERFGGNMLRKAIDYFCHLAVEPSFYGQLSNGDTDFMRSEYAQKLNWLKDDRDDIYDPDYSDMLRVSFMHQFGRGRLSDLVSLLSGRDFIDRKFKEEISEASFIKLKSGVLNFMNEYHFKQFTLAIRSAGFISPKLLGSKMTLDFAYTLYLLMQQSDEIPKVQIKSAVQKLFVLATLTGRYVGSQESQMDRDLRSIASKGFRAFFEESEAAVVSDAFWEIGLVQRLETSSVSSPYFSVFIAALIFSGERSLLSSSSRVSDLILTMGDVHHIFPREYLKRNGFDDRSVYNQVANYTHLDTGVNISIGKKAPCEYFTQALNQCDVGNATVGTILDKDAFYQNLDDHCIPRDVLNMKAEDYPKFLLERRKRMARRIREYYENL